MDRIGEVSWTRFWIPRDVAPALDQHGYLDPATDLKRNARTLDQLDVEPCLALLGEPASGKSFELSAHHARLRARREREPMLFVDCRWHRDLRADLFDAAPFVAWIAGQAELTLILDSLDEHPAGAYEAARQLLSQIVRGPIGSLRLRVACRSAAWPPVLDEHLPRLWQAPEPAAIFWKLAPPRAIDVERAAGKDAARLLAEVKRLGAEVLASKPVTFAFLLEELRRRGELPRKRADLFERAATILCEEASRSRRAAGSSGKLRAEERLTIAARIAAVCVLGRRATVFLGPELGDVPDDGVRAEDLAGGMDRNGHGHVPVDASAITEVMERSGLFVSAGPERLTWADPVLPGFLAARFLHGWDLSAKCLERELCDEVTGRVASSLESAAAWMADRRKDFFLRLLEIDPEVLLRCDLASMEDTERQALVDSLLEQIQRRDLTLIEFSFRRGALAQLSYPGLAEQIRSYACDRAKGALVRRAAIVLAGACRLNTIQATLAEIALARDDDGDVRSTAAGVLAKLGDRATKRKLKPLIHETCGSDAEENVKGAVLQALWPLDLEATELFSVLSPTEEWAGVYSQFLIQLGKSLPISALPPALLWTMQVPSRRDGSWSVVSLLDDILQLAWKKIDEPGVSRHLAMAVHHRLGMFDGLFGRRATDDASLDISRDHRRRRLLVEAMLAVEAANRHGAFELISRGLILDQDAQWLIDKIRAGAEPSLKARWIDVLSLLARWRWTFEVADPILGALDELDALREALPWLVQWVDLGSPESRWMRREHRHARKYVARYKLKERKPRAPRAVAGRVRRSLLGFERGHIRSAVDLQHWLSISPDDGSQHSFFEWNLVALPGWRTLDEETRKRIVEAGKKYLLSSDDHAAEWLGSNQLDPAAAAGYRYLCLIDALDPAWLSEHGSEIWPRWSAITLSFVLNASEHSQHMVEMAYQANGVRVREVLRVLLMKNLEHDYPFALYQMERCWDEALGEFLVGFIRQQEIKPKFAGELLNQMLSHEIMAAIEYARSWLVSPPPADGDGRHFARACAHALMAFLPEIGWPVIFPLIDVDPEFGREVFLSFAEELRRDRSRDWAARLPTDQAADLFVWMEQNFPQAEDPHHPSGAVYSVTPRDMIGQMRDRFSYALASRGTRDVVRAFEDIQQRLPDRDLSPHIGTAKSKAAEKAMKRRSPREIISMRIPCDVELDVPLDAAAPSGVSLFDQGHDRRSRSPVIRPPNPKDPVKSLVNWLPHLLDAYKQDKLALLVGSGLSMAKDVEGNFPSWKSLPGLLLDQLTSFGEHTSEEIEVLRRSLDSNCSTVAQITRLDPVKQALGRNYKDAIDAIFRPRGMKCGDVHRAVIELGCSLVVTTNYDQLLESAEGAPARDVHTWKDSTNVVSDLEHNRKVLFKIHGSAEKADTIVMTQREYDVVDKDGPYKRIMGQLVQSYSFLFGLVRRICGRVRARAGDQANETARSE